MLPVLMKLNVVFWSKIIFRDLFFLSGRFGPFGNFHSPTHVSKEVRGHAPLPWNLVISKYGLLSFWNLPLQWVWLVCKDHLWWIMYPFFHLLVIWRGNKVCVFPSHPMHFQSHQHKISDTNKGLMADIYDIPYLYLQNLWFRCKSDKN